MKDIGVTVQTNLKFTRHCTHIVKKAYFVIRNILYILHVKLYAYTTYVRPSLEYASQEFGHLS